MNRFGQIDILRAVAVFLVMGRHLTPCPRETSEVFHYVTRLWARGGWIGVDLFFVLSGFLVSGLLFREYERYRHVRIGHFLIRRGFKIYPPFWLLIGVTVLVVLVRGEALAWPAVVSELLYVQNYGPYLWRHTWSIAVEEHFYLLLAIGVWAMARRRVPQPFAMVPVLCLVIGVTSLGLRVWVAAWFPYEHAIHFFPSHLRLDGLCFGVLLAYWFHRQPDRVLSVARRYRWALIVLGVFLLMPAFAFRLDAVALVYTLGFTLFYLGSGCLLVAALGFPAPRSRFSSALAYAGSHSYSVYLWHVPVEFWGSQALVAFFPSAPGWFVYASGYFVVSLGVGILMANLIESPVLRLRDRWFPSRGTPLRLGSAGGG